MNNDDCVDATYQPISLNNEATPDATVFAGAAPAPTAGAATTYTIVPYSHGGGC